MTGIQDYAIDAFNWTLSRLWDYGQQLYRIFFMIMLLIASYYALKYVFKVGAK